MEYAVTVPTALVIAIHASVGVRAIGRWLARRHWLKTHQAISATKVYQLCADGHITNEEAVDIIVTQKDVTLW